jgi:hypothetical protein
MGMSMSMGPFVALRPFFGVASAAVASGVPLTYKFSFLSRLAAFVFIVEKSLAVSLVLGVLYSWENGRWADSMSRSPTRSNSSGYNN